MAECRGDRRAVAGALRVRAAVGLVAKTGRLVCVSDANLRGSWLNTIAAKLTEEAFDELDAPVVVLGARNWIAPPAELEWEYFVTPEDIIDACTPGSCRWPGTPSAGARCGRHL